MLKYSFVFFLFTIFFLACSTENNNENHQTLKIESEAKIAQKNKALILPKIRDKALASPTLKRNVSNQEIESVSTTLLNRSGTTQTQLDEAIFLLYSMKKEDYQKTWLQYYQKQIAEVPTNYKHPEVIEREERDARSRLDFERKKFEFAKEYADPFPRLTPETQKTIQMKAMKWSIFEGKVGEKLSAEEKEKMWEQMKNL